MVVEGKRQFGAAQHNSVTFMSRHIRSPSVHGWNKEKWRASVSGRRAISYPCEGEPQGSPSIFGRGFSEAHAVSGGWLVCYEMDWVEAKPTELHMWNVSH